MPLEPKTFGAGERSLEGWCMEVGRRKVDQKQGKLLMTRGGRLPVNGVAVLDF
jgi:hypothetical protein